MYKDTIKAIDNICSGEKSTLDSPAQVKLVTPDGEDKFLSTMDVIMLMVNGEKMIKYSEHQVLLTAHTGGGKSSSRGKGKNRVFRSIWPM